MRDDSRAIVRVQIDDGPTQPLTAVRIYMAESQPPPVFWSRHKKWATASCQEHRRPERHELMGKLPPGHPAGKQKVHTSPDIAAVKAAVSFASVLRKRGVDLRQDGNDLLCRCPIPGHDDGNDSFRLYDDGHAHCFGCDWHGDVINFVADVDGLTKPQALKKLGAGIAPTTPDRVTRARSFDYHDRDGNVLFTVKRGAGKKFTAHPKGIAKENRPLYRLPELLASDGAVVVVEGEKDADSLTRMGITATSCAFGAGKWLPHYPESLRGREVVVWPDKDKPGHKHANTVLSSLVGVASSLRRVEPPDYLEGGGDASDVLAARGEVEVRRLVDEAKPWTGESLTVVGDVVDEPTEPPPSFRWTADVKTKEVVWMWNPRIPLGHVTDLSGDPGVGKSTLALALAANLSNGVTPGDSVPTSAPARSLLLSAEDHPETTTRPRLEAMGADLTRIAIVDQVFGFDEVGLANLDSLVEQVDPELVVIDPLVAYLHETDMHRANEVRAVMAALSDLAERRNCAVLVLRHLNKGAGGKAIYRSIGSIDFVAAVRSALLAGADPDDPSKRALAHVKSNLGPMVEPLGYSIDGGVFGWTGKTQLTAGRILGDGEDQREAPARAEAEEFLRNELADGARKVKELEGEAKDAGISTTALRRARQRICRSRKGGIDAGWLCELKPEDDH